MNMAPTSNTSSLENLNGSVRSTHVNSTCYSITLATSRAAGSAHPSTYRNHTYPAPVAREYHYADNSAAGHNLHHSNSSFETPAVMYQEPATLYQYSTNPAPTRSQTYLLPPASYDIESYDTELNLDDEQADNTVEQGQYPPPQYPSEAPYPSSRPNSDYGHSDTEQPSQPTTTDLSDEDHQYLLSSSTPAQQETYNIRSESSTTQRYLQEDASEERIRLGLPRQERRGEHRTYERSSRHGSHRHGSSRRESTRRH